MYSAGDGTEFARELLARPEIFDPDLSFLVAGIVTTDNFEADGIRLRAARAECQLPIPLLRQHDWNHPIGSVLRTKVHLDSLWFEARIANAAWAAEAWAEIKAAKLTGVSLEPIANSDDFSRWGIREISICDEARNPDAIVYRVWERFRPSFYRFDREKQEDITVHREIGPAISFREAPRVTYYR